MISHWDSIFFLLTFVIVLVVGLYAGREEKTKEDYFLGGRSLPWWGVCGSLFGTNISANHIVGMLGIGFSVGFAQSHYEFGSIPAILLLAYVILPILRRKKFYTLSEFLSRRYGKISSNLYTIISLMLILIQLTGALYIGGRAFLPFAKQVSASIQYEHLVIIIAFTSTIYTWFGGLKSVVYTDVIQTVLILISGIVLAYLAINRAEIGGLSGLMEKEMNSPHELSRMSIYLPANHEVLPWTGVLSGMFILHIFYWNTNQYVVQRALGAVSLKEARLGIIASGFLKLTVPFFSILTGVAAYHIWNHDGLVSAIDPDEAFSKLVIMIVPAGYGLIGFILAGLLGAIFSSIDSMLHSAATLFTIDIYLPLIKRIKYSGSKMPKEIEDFVSIQMGRWFIIFFAILTTLLALVFFDPNSKSNFFITLSSHSSNFTPGLLVVFIFGMFWNKSHPTSAWITILITPILSYLAPAIYSYLFQDSLISEYFGNQLNFLHRVFLITIFSSIFHLLLSITLEKKIKKQDSNLDLQTNNFKVSLHHFIIILYIFSILVGIYLKINFEVSGYLLFGFPLFASVALGLYSRKIDLFFSSVLFGITAGLYFLF